MVDVNISFMIHSKNERKKNMPAMYYRKVNLEIRVPSEQRKENISRNVNGVYLNLYI
jgi:hypothetical protein